MDRYYNRAKIVPLRLSYQEPVDEELSGAIGGVGDWDARDPTVGSWNVEISKLRLEDLEPANGKQSSLN